MGCGPEEVRKKAALPTYSSSSSSSTIEKKKGIRHLELFVLICFLFFFQHLYCANEWVGCVPGIPQNMNHADCNPTK